jgi:hypothetical protein
VIGHRSDEILHQAFFGWSELDKRQTLLISSMSATDENQWLHWLDRYTRLQTVTDAPAPPHTLSYFVFGDMAALMRRVRHGYSDGRTNSHVLIGPAGLLDTSAALALETWPDWQTAPPAVLEPFPASKLATTADKYAAEQFRPHVDRLEHRLASALCRLLDDPYLPLTIVDCPEKDRLPLVWGLREVAAEHLPIDMPWTFSTYEDRHDVEGLPHIIFVPVLPKTAAVVRRATVRTTEAPTGQHAKLAIQLVARFLHGTPLTAETRKEQPVFEPDRSLHEKLPAEQPAYESRPETRHVFERSGRADGLLTANSVESLQQELRSLGSKWIGPQGREVLRRDLDTEVLSTAAQTVEIVVREELLTKLLEVTYGPDLADLDDPVAVRHAADVVRHCPSEQLAMMIGASARRKFSDEVWMAALERWTSSYGVAPTRLPGRSVRVTAAARGGGHVPIVLAVAGVAVLLIVFLLGYLAA